MLKDDKKKKKKIRPSPTFRISHWLFMSQMSFQYVNRPFMSKETNRKKGGEKRGREKGREEGREKEGKKNKAVWSKQKIGKQRREEPGTLEGKTLALTLQLN